MTKWLIILGLTLLAVFTKGLFSFLLIGALAYFAVSKFMSNESGTAKIGSFDSIFGNKGQGQGTYTLR